MSLASSDWAEADRRQIEERGLDLQEAERQLALLRDPPRPARLARPCRPGDGMTRLREAEHPSLLAAADQATARGRLAKMVPASGAASRMFKDLVALQQGGRGEAEIAAGQRFLDHLSAFPFYRELTNASRGPGLRDLLAAALGPAGLNLDQRPKALLPFHLYEEGPRTAFAEHLAEGAGHIADSRKACRFHFTVSAEHGEAFSRHLEGVRNSLEAATGCSFQVSFSHQSPATDTLALHRDGSPFRRGDGRLLFRPGGHGSLLRNLHALGGDIVSLKNIDNIVPENRRGPVLRWKRLLTGHLVRLQERVFEIRRGLESGEPTESWLREALDFVGRELWIDGAKRVQDRSGAAARTFLTQALDRPIRVCGMVPNAGEPGGGPFMVRGEDGTLSPQIVESSQVDHSDPEQKAILRESTHFNPVDLLCGLRDHRDRHYDLPRFVDPTTVFISQKSAAGKELQALEHPGLWNGAMARWITVFVEVPPETFAPVKTLFDLLRPQHQTRAAR